MVAFIKEEMINRADMWFRSEVSLQELITPQTSKSDRANLLVGFVWDKTCPHGTSRKRRILKDE